MLSNLPVLGHIALKDIQNKLLISNIFLSLINLKGVFMVANRYTT